MSFQDLKQLTVHTLSSSEQAKTHRVVGNNLDLRGSDAVGNSDDLFLFPELGLCGSRVDISFTSFDQVVLVKEGVDNRLSVCLGFLKTFNWSLRTVAGALLLRLSKSALSLLILPVSFSISFRFVNISLKASFMASS